MVRVCPDCDLENITARTICKRCRASVSAIAPTHPRAVVRPPASQIQRVPPRASGHAPDQPKKHILVRVVMGGCMLVYMLTAGSIIYGGLLIHVITMLIMHKCHLPDRLQKSVFRGVCAGIVLALAVVFWRVIA
jgi:hypothetical protein